MVGGQWQKQKNSQGEDTNRYVGGKWIEVTYGRPMKRQRSGLFSSGADYGKALLEDAPIWRVGANQTTRFRTEATLQFEGKTLPAGEYSLFVDLKEGGWTLVFSSQKYQEEWDSKDKTRTYGAFNYDPKFDVLRASMKVDKLEVSVDQLSIGFIDVSVDRGTLAIWWDREMATVPFSVVQ